jgi:hypothetical protein
MNKSESIAQLATALSSAQAEMLPAKMSSTNPFLKNKYADLGEIIQAARPALAKNGLAFTQLPTTTDGKLAVETILMHKSGEWLSSIIELPLGDEKGRSLAQNAGSIITYLRRYSLAAILGIYADEDVDGNNPKLAPKNDNPEQKLTPKNDNPEPKPIPQAAWDKWLELVNAANEKNLTVQLVEREKTTVDELREKYQALGKLVRETK